MNRELLKKLNQRPISYYPVYRQITGSTTAGILLSQLMYWFSKKDKIFKTDQELRDETLLTEKELKSAKANIKKLDFITVSREGLPAKTYYEIDWEKYAETLNNVQTREVKSSKQVGTNRPNCTGQIVQSNKNNNLITETTTETTHNKDAGVTVQVENEVPIEYAGKPKTSDDILKVYPQVSPFVAEIYLGSRFATGWKRNRAVITDWVQDFRVWLMQYEANHKQQNEAKPKGDFIDATKLKVVC